MKMKSIEEYLNEIINRKDPEYDFLDECILKQLGIYYKFNLDPITVSIVESKGRFPNQEQIVNKILNEIDSSQDVSIVKIDNDIVDKIYLHFKTEENSDFYCEYIVDIKSYDDYNIVRWDNNNKRYKFAEINIVNYTANKNHLEEFLYHETQHLWDDYQSMIHKNIPLSDKVKNSLDTKFNNSNIDKTVKDILYYTNDYEISAYISQMNELFNGKKFDDIKDAFNKIIYPTPIYKNYKLIYYALYNDKYVDMLCNAGIKKSEITNMKKSLKESGTK